MLSRRRQIGWTYEDNLHAIYLLKNQHVGAKTKLVDIRVRFIHELEEQVSLAVQFVQSDEICRHFELECPEKHHMKHVTQLRNGNLKCCR